MPTTPEEVIRRSESRAGNGEPSRLCLVLHAHLPFVRHPEHPRFLEEDWLFEAIFEVYLPLLDLLGRLRSEGIRTPVTVSISPTLAAMLDDPLLRGRFVLWLEGRERFLRAEEERTRLVPPVHRLVERYLRETEIAREEYCGSHRTDLLSSFARAGNGVELTTTNATHGFLPLIGDRRELWRGQIAVARDAFRARFGHVPGTHWLSECGYTAGIDEELYLAGVRAFCLEEIAIRYARGRPVYGAFAPVLSPGGTLVFPRDAVTSREIWAAGAGFPAAPEYRDFHHDVGWELEFDYLAPFLHGGGSRNPLAVRYHRVTGRGARKRLYVPETAHRLARRHAAEFWQRRERQVSRLGLDRPVVITLPFDAELFGHWWYEGPVFLEELFRLAARSNLLHLTTLEEAAAAERRVQRLDPIPSSWGEGGYFAFWLDPANDWIVGRVRRIGERMVTLVDAVLRGVGPRSEVGGPRIERVLRQLARELLLAQSSDWPFILKTGVSSGYAAARVVEHLEAFSALYDDLVQGRLSDERLGAREERTPIFAELDWRHFASERSERHDGDDPGADQV